MSKVSITKSKLDNLANAVAAKSGIPVLLSVDEMTDAVLGISVGEENVLEGVKVNGIELPITNKKVNIPVASQNQAGVITAQMYSDLSNLSNLSDVAYSGSYLDLSNTPGIPVVVSNITDMAGYYVMFTDSAGTGITERINKNFTYGVSSNIARLTLGSLDNNGKNGRLRLFNDTYYVEIGPTTLTGHRTITLPNKDGTIALTSDIIDEKLKTTQYNTLGTYYIIFGNLSSTASVKYCNSSLRYEMNATSDILELGMSSQRIGEIKLHNNSGGSSASISIVPPSQPALVATITLPNKTGTLALTSDIPDVRDFITTETDPTVPSWAKQSSKPTYTASEVGALPDSTVIPTKTSDLTNDSGYLTSYTETDPTVPSWAKQSSKPSYTFSELTTHPTSVSGYGITDAYTKSEVDSKVSAVLKYKGVKATIGDLPSTGNTTGDTWHVTATSGEYAWDGTEWQELGTAISIPANTGSSTAGISIGNHSTDSIYGVSSSTTSVYGVSTSTTTASKVTVGSSSTDYGVTAAGSGNASLTFTMDTTDTKKLKISFTHTHTAPTLGSKVPTVSASDVTVPIKNADATTVPIKNAGATTVVTSATHSVTDTGHTHTI